MKLRENFLTVCGGCDGTGEYEEAIGGFENSVTYKLTKCDCENGKELDWQRIDSEIKETEMYIHENSLIVEVLKNLMLEAYNEGNKDLLLSRYGKLIDAKKKEIQLQTYLAELEIIE